MSDEKIKPGDRVTLKGSAYRKILVVGYVRDGVAICYHFIKDENDEHILKTDNIHTEALSKIDDER